MPSPSKDYFEFFGLQRRLVVDAEVLQRRFYELSRQWHPDRFGRRPVEEQNEALEATSVLNDGYRTLRDPMKRAMYVLAQEGFPIGEQRSKNVPPELLEEVFELNMMLEEIRSGDESQRHELESAGKHFLEMRAEIDGHLEGLFQRYDAAAPESESAKQALQEIRNALNKRRYIENLVRDVDRALNAELKPEQREL
ncbi:MAG TPA: Fe-S protein assembly co-chaperone HscB [Bryobacteraceae bacterium]|nr:Fe-S protein assembly co-chaperone HscB [Bryobacteraceae bacterium]